MGRTQTWVSHSPAILRNLSKMLSIAVLSCLVGLSVQAGFFFPANPSPANTMDPKSWTKPWFCHANDCPMYTVMDTNDQFETRMYQPSQWVATELTTMLYSDNEKNDIFFKLFHYIDGNNTMNKKIAMTSPVVTEIRHGAGPDCESNFTMHFMVPFAYQPNPPTPTEDGVFIKNVPAFTVYVKQYPGFPKDDVQRRMIEEFTNDLMAANKNFDDRVYMTAGYDGPYTFTGRHNEIWVIPK